MSHQLLISLRCLTSQSCLSACCPPSERIPCLRCGLFKAPSPLYFLLPTRPVQAFFPRLLPSPSPLARPTHFTSPLPGHNRYINPVRHCTLYDTQNSGSLQFNLLSPCSICFDMDTQAVLLHPSVERKTEYQICSFYTSQFPHEWKVIVQTVVMNRMSVPARPENFKGSDILTPSSPSQIWWCNESGHKLPDVLLEAPWLLTR